MTGQKCQVRSKESKNERCIACLLCLKEDEPKCERCHPSCTECKGPGPLNCTVCPATMQLYLEQSRCLPCCSDSDPAATPECCDCHETQGRTILRSGKGAEGLYGWLGQHLKIKRGMEQKTCCWTAGTQCVPTAPSAEQEGLYTNIMTAITTDRGVVTFFHSQPFCSRARHFINQATGKCLL